MDTYKRKELLVGALMLGAGLFYLFLTINLPRKGFIDASTVPYVLSVGLCLLGVLQLLTATKATQPPVDPDADADPSAATPPDYPTVFKTLGLIADAVTQTGSVAGMILALDKYLDVSQYLRFWIGEVLSNHQDSWNSKGNNFYIYYK